MTKEEKIQEAYGEHWEKVKYFVDKDGWLDSRSFYGQPIHKGLFGLTMEISDPYDPKYCYWKRPVSLSGINNNNGWRKIESENDLPVKDGLFIVCIDEKPIVGIIENIEFIKHLYDCPEQGILTHFQEYIPKKPPIY